MSEFKDGDYVRIVNEKSADCGKTGQVFRTYKGHALVTFDGRYATFFDYSDIAPDDTPDDGGRCCDVEPPKPDNRIDADLLLMQIQLMHENHYSVAKHKSGKGEPRGYCRALKDIESIVRGMKQEGETE